MREVERDSFVDGTLNPLLDDALGKVENIRGGDVASLSHML
jgi:hypothetical protein